jgi:hypothetical protein
MFGAPRQSLGQLVQMSADELAYWLRNKTHRTCALFWDLDRWDEIKGHIIRLCNYAESRKDGRTGVGKRHLPEEYLDTLTGHSQGIDLCEEIRKGAPIVV